MKIAMITLMMLSLFTTISYGDISEEKQIANSQCRANADKEIGQLQSLEREDNKKKKTGQITIFENLERSHYSQTLKVCLIIIKTENRVVGMNNPNPIGGSLSIDFTLKALYEETKYGIYNRVFIVGNPTQYMKCYVKDLTSGKPRNCQNKEEWDNLIKPYMEN